MGPGKQFADVVDEDGHRLVVRNGYHQQRDVVTGARAAGERQAGGPGNQ